VMTGAIELSPQVLTWHQPSRRLGATPRETRHRRTT
jgi:hypothetical protein